MIEKSQVSIINLEGIRQIMESVGFLNVQIFTEADSPWSAILAQK